MNTEYHGVSIVCTDCSPDTMSAELQARGGDSVTLSFDSLDDLELLAHELWGLAATIRDMDPAPVICGICEGSGMGMTPMDTCPMCKGEGETA